MSPSDFLFSVPAGTTLFRQGDPGDYAYVVEEGEVEVVVGSEGAERQLARMGPGTLIGEMALIDSLPRTATVRTTTAATFIRLDQQAMRTYLDDADPIVRMLLNVVLQRFREALWKLGGHRAPPTPDITPMIAPARVAHAAAVDRLRLEHELREAIAREDLFLVFQPIVSFETGCIAGFEALVRWQHPVRGTIYPDQFIPAAEESGLIVPMGRWTLRGAARMLRDFRRAARHHGAPDDLFMAINASAREVAHPRFLGDLSEALVLTGSDPERLVIEVTESVCIGDPDHTRDLLDKVRGMGFRTAIDDFGTGYSSLSYLHRFPFHKLKIDKAFVQAMTEPDGTSEIVRSIVTMAHGLGLDVVAEGVETEEHARQLARMGVRYAQGYLWARPLAASDAVDLLRTWQPLSWRSAEVA